MARAVEGLAPHADFCLVDGLPVKGLPVPHRAIVKGDGRSLSLPAASVLAKVTRDRMMTEAGCLLSAVRFLQNTRDMARKPTWKPCGGMGPVRFIAARLRRFHKWNCPFLNRKERDTAWLGMYGELAAASFLRGEGFSVLRRNWRPVRGGELDLVCRDGNCLVFVEVKTRTGKQLRGSPPRRGRPQKGADTAGSGGMAPPASGTGSLPLRYCGSPVPGGEAPGIQAYTRSVQGEGFARFMKSAAGAGRSEDGYGARTWPLPQ